jgi:hypothetical protein
MPGATRRLPSSVLVVCGWGWATAQRDGALLAGEVVPPLSSTPLLSRPIRWPTAPRCAGSWATATTGTRGGPGVRLVAAPATERAWRTLTAVGGWFGLDDHIDHNRDHNRDHTQVS